MASPIGERTLARRCALTVGPPGWSDGFAVASRLLAWTLVARTA